MNTLTRLAQHIGLQRMPAAAPATAHGKVSIGASQQPRGIQSRLLPGWPALHERNVRDVTALSAKTLAAFGSNETQTRYENFITSRLRAQRDGSEPPVTVGANIHAPTVFKRDAASAALPANAPPAAAAASAAAPPLHAPALLSSRNRPPPPPVPPRPAAASAANPAPASRPAPASAAASASQALPAMRDIVLPTPTAVVKRLDNFLAYKRYNPGLADAAPIQGPGREMHMARGMLSELPEGRHKVNGLPTSTPTTGKQMLEKLAALFGNVPAGLTPEESSLIAEATKCAHRSGIAEGLRSILDSADSPIGALAGMPGRIQGDEHTSYEFSRDEDSRGIRIAVTHQINARTFESGGQAFDLAPGSSAKFRFDIVVKHVDGDGSVPAARIVGNSFMRYDLVPASTATSTGK